MAAARRKQGRHEKTPFLIIDAQSVQNADTAMEKGYDAGKKVSGIKRHIAVDTQGFPHTLAVTTAADVTDKKAVWWHWNMGRIILAWYKKSLLMVVTRGRHLLRRYRSRLVRRWRLQNETNYTVLRYYRSDG